MPESEAWNVDNGVSSTTKKRGSIELDNFLCESRGGRPGLPVPNKSTVSADVTQHSTNLRSLYHISSE